MHKPKPSISFSFIRISLVAILSIFIQSSTNLSSSLSYDASNTEVTYEDLFVESMHDSHAENVSEERNEEREAFLNCNHFFSDVKLPLIYFIQKEQLTTLFEEVIPHPPEVKV